MNRVLEGACNFNSTCRCDKDEIHTDGCTTNGEAPAIDLEGFTWPRRKITASVRIEPLSADILAAEACDEDGGGPYSESFAPRPQEKTLIARKRRTALRVKESAKRGSFRISTLLSHTTSSYNLAKIGHAGQRTPRQFLPRRGPHLELQFHPRPVGGALLVT